MSNPSKLAAEAVGTFMLCFIGAGAICLSTMKGASAYEGLIAVAIAHGIALSVAVSATMNVSGGHVNPAVTVAMLVTGRISLGEAIAYIVAQCAGATVAGLMVYLVFKGFALNGATVVKAAGLGTPTYNPNEMGMGLAILIEAFLTFLLVFAVFGTAVDPRAPKIGGFGIGLTICADILVGGPLTGAAMNPARTFGPGLVAWVTGNLSQSQFWGQHAVYWIGPILGAVAAGLIYDGLIMEKKR